jgi:hypothetical protein
MSGPAWPLNRSGPRSGCDGRPGVALRHALRWLFVFVTLAVLCSKGPVLTPPELSSRDSKAI